MKIVSVINYKGGVGKTSLTSNLAAELAWRGKNILLIDLDAQASLTFSYITPDEWRKDFEDKGTIKAWYDNYDSKDAPSLKSFIFFPERAARKLKSKGKLCLIPSHLGLINVDLELATKLGGANLAQAKKNFIDVHSRLAKELETLKGEFDLVLVDCPPNFNIVTKTAIIASDFLLVPARPDYLSTLGIDYLIRSVTQLVKEYNEYAEVSSGIEVDTIDPKVLGVVFTMIQEYGGGPMSSHREFINRVTSMSGLQVFESYIKRNDTMFADAPQSGIPPVLNHYTNPSHSSVVSGLENLAQEFAHEIGI